MKQQQGNKQASADNYFPAVLGNRRRFVGRPDCGRALWHTGVAACETGNGEMAVEEGRKICNYILK